MVGWILREGGGWDTSSEVEDEGDEITYKDDEEIGVVTNKGDGEIDEEVGGWAIKVGDDDTWTEKGRSNANGVMGVGEIDTVIGW